MTCHIELLFFSSQQYLESNPTDRQKSVYKETMYTQGQKITWYKRIGITFEEDEFRTQLYH